MSSILLFFPFLTACLSHKPHVFPAPIIHSLTPLGELTLPKIPNRVAVLDSELSLDLALTFRLAVHILPVPHTELDERLSNPLRVDAQKILRRSQTHPVNLGQFRADNLEQLKAAHPDVIIGKADTLRSYYPQLTEIAPTLLIQATSWRDATNEIGKYLHREADAKTILQDYDALSAHISAHFAAIIARNPISYFQLTSRDISFPSHSLITDVVESLHAPRSTIYTHNPAQEKINVDQAIPQLSDAKIALINTTDYPVISVAKRSISWMNVPAMRNNVITPLDSAVLAGGPTTARKILIQLAEVYATLH